MNFETLGYIVLDNLKIHLQPTDGNLSEHYLMCNINFENYHGIGTITFKLDVCQNITNIICVVCLFDPANKLKTFIETLLKLEKI
jgi:hypothetical protein